MADVRKSSFPPELELFLDGKISLAAANELWRARLKSEERAWEQKLVGYAARLITEHNAPAVDDEVLRRQGGGEIWATDRSKDNG